MYHEFIHGIQQQHTVKQNKNYDKAVKYLNKKIYDETLKQICEILWFIEKSEMDANLNLFAKEYQKVVDGKMDIKQCTVLKKYNEVVKNMEEFKKNPLFAKNCCEIKFDIDFSELLKSYEKAIAYFRKKFYHVKMTCENGGYKNI